MNFEYPLRIEEEQLWAQVCCPDTPVIQGYISLYILREDRYGQLIGRGTEMQP